MEKFYFTMEFFYLPLENPAHLWYNDHESNTEDGA